MSPAFFSIIIPTFNSGSTLPDALNSISMQSMQDFQLIIIDGNSTDNTLQIIGECKMDPSKILVISEKDNGIYDAMNKGIKNSSGQWLYFLGSDDALVNSTVLRTLQQILVSDPVDMLYGNIIRKNDGKKFGGEFNIMRLLTQHNITHQAILYKKTVFEKIGFYNLNYNVWADWEFNIRCFRHTELRRKYTDTDIAIYNNLSGLSSLEDDAVFKKELPKFYIQELNELRYSKEYKLGTRIYKFFNFISGKK
jgi:glycosyltransferase involved in cell wall biosynthesis